MDNHSLVLRSLLEDFNDLEIIEEVYDENPALASALAAAIPGFEYPDWSHRTIKQIKRFVEQQLSESINPANDLPFMTTCAGHVLIHAADGGSLLSDDWTGLCVDGSDVSKFWHIGRDNGERSFTALQARTYDAAIREGVISELRGKRGGVTYLDSDVELQPVGPVV